MPKLKKWIYRGLYVAGISSNLIVGTNCTLNAQASVGRMEFTKLIQLYMLPQGASFNEANWDTGSDTKTPISWNHNGTRECEAYLEKEYGVPFCRNGSIALTILGKPTHTILERTIQPARWNVVLMGSRGGVSFVKISSNVLSQNLDPGLLKAIAKQTHKALTVTSLNQCGGSTNGTELLRVVSSGRQAAYIQEKFSCGTAGCGFEFVMMSNEQDAKNLMEAACR